MTLTFALPLAAAVFSTSFVSGVFGMAGGMLLMGFLLLMMPLQAAMVLHGVTQMTANGWRAVMLRRHIDWRIVGWYALGALLAAAGLAFLRFVPEKATVLILIGLVPLMGLAVPARFALTARRPSHAVMAGVINAVLQIMAGVTGPVLDLFFVRSGLPRQENVATKGAVQVLGHLLKVVYFGSMMLSAHEAPITWPGVVIGVGMAALGTSAAKRLLEAMTDQQFYRWSRIIILTISCFYLYRGITLLFG